MNQEIINNTINEIIDIYQQLSSQEDLKPSDTINHLFSRLVNIVLTTPDNIAQHILENQKIKGIHKKLQAICSQGEYELEYFWVNKLLKETNINNTILRQFPYYSNYEKMAELETYALYTCQLHNKHNILFVGSGPLPLSSMIMSDVYDLKIDNLDYNEEACSLSSKLLRQKNIVRNNTSEVICKDILHITDFTKYDGIIIAALVGINEEEKLRVIEHIVRHANKGTHIALRGCSKIGTLLYPEIPQKGLELINITHKYKQPRGIINNLIIGTI